MNPMPKLSRAEWGTCSITTLEVLYTMWESLKPRDPESFPRPAEASIVGRIFNTEVRRSPIFVLSAALVLVLAVALVASPALALPSTFQGGAATISPVYHSATLESPTMNVSYCDLLGQANGLGTTNYSANVSEIWTKLCVRHDFQTLINQWGDLRYADLNNSTSGSWVALNLTFQDGGPIGVPPTVTFVVTWLAVCQNQSLGEGTCAFTEYWNGNVSTNVITGPFQTQSQDISTGGGNSTSHPSPSLVAGLAGGWFVWAIGAVVVVAIAVLALVARRPGGGQSRFKTDHPPQSSEYLPAGDSLAAVRSERARSEDQSDVVSTGVDGLDDLL
jgi:hypothetical protein